MKKTIWLAMIIILVPSVLADILAPPPSAMIGAGIIIIAVAAVLNYGINFALSVPVSLILADVDIRDIARGLLVITPIMLLAEAFFIAVLEPQHFGTFIGVWLFSFLLIFICYYIIGEKMWGMTAWQSAVLGIIMGILTNPMYILLFIQ